MIIRILLSDGYSSEVVSTVMPASLSLTNAKNFINYRASVRRSYFSLQSVLYKMCGWAGNGGEPFPLLYHLADGSNQGTSDGNSAQCLLLTNALSSGSSKASCCLNSEVSSSLPLMSVTLPLMNCPGNIWRN